MSANALRVQAPPPAYFKLIAFFRAGDDAKAVEVVEASRLTSLDFAFDHALLVSDYLELKKHKSFPEKRSKPWHRRSSCPL